MTERTFWAVVGRNRNGNGGEWIYTIEHDRATASIRRNDANDIFQHAVYVLRPFKARIPLAESVRKQPRKRKRTSAGR